MTEVQARIFQPKRPEEELYDLRNDPFEIRNLADDPEYQQRLLSMRAKLDTWIEESGDRGRESEAMYDSDMAVYVNSQKTIPGPDRCAQTQYRLDEAGNPGVSREDG